MQHYKLFFIILSSFILSACEQHEYTATYLKQHPRKLEAAFNRCQSLQTKTQPQEKQCDVVSEAVSAIADIINDQRNNPEQFGLRVLRAEMAMRDYENKLVSAKQQLAQLKSTSTNTNNVTGLENDIKKYQERYEAKLEEVTTLLAVIGMSSPE